MASLAYGYLTLRGTWFPLLGLGGPARESQTKPTYKHGGDGGRGGGPFLPQLTPQQEVGKSWDEAGRVAGILEIKIMMIANLLST